MNDNSHLPNLLVLGVGDGGINTINRMVETGVEGVNLVAVDTDAQVLEVSKAPSIFQIGEDLTAGTGTGGDVELAKEAADDKRQEFKALAESMDLVFLTAGLGGGTGSGASPIISSIIGNLSALTVGVVTTPFGFEGTTRMERATTAVEELEQNLDALIVVSNNQLLQSVSEDISMVQAFQIADRVLQQGIQGISDLITYPGLINLDLADIRSVLEGVGRAVIGMGEGSGEDKAQSAARQASSNPLLEEGTIQGARNLILNITGGPNLKLGEARQAAKMVREATDTQASMIFGAVVKDTLDEQAQVTVIAADFRQASTSEEVEPEVTSGPVDRTDLNVPAFLRKQNQEESP